MKILFISRSTLFKDKGGDTIQVQNTAEYLRKIDVHVDIRLCDEHNIDYSQYDLIHFFNIIRPADILQHIERSKKPYVVSTIYVDYSEYEKRARGGPMGLLFKLVPGDAIEYAKVIARLLLNGEKIISPSYLFLGQSRSIKKIMRGASMLLPNSESEYRRLVNHYKVDSPFKVVPNAVDPLLFKKTNSLVRDANLVVCAGRIEGRKNQLNLILALRDTRFNLVIIGSASPNQMKYHDACRAAATSNVSFVGSLSQKELIDYYRRAKVHVLPSWFETTGLSSLEAAAMGCEIVVTRKGDTVEYFENHAFYCEPDSVRSIFEAVEKASTHEYDETLRNKIFDRYTWVQAAEKTKEAYQEITQKNS